MEGNILRNPGSCLEYCPIISIFIKYVDEKESYIINDSEEKEEEEETMKPYEECHKVHRPEVNIVW